MTDPHSAPRPVGTQARGLPDLARWHEPLPPRAHALAIASAYWDKGSCARALAMAAGLPGTTRLLLWTAGASRPAWVALRKEHAAAGARLDLRFVDSPETGGIFHVKLAGLAAADGPWLRALVGSANLTGAAFERNVELGVVLDGDGPAVEPLRTWFDDQFDHALPAADLDWDTAVEIAPATSEANERRTLFAAAALAPPARVP